jgi:hypothetical protein
MELENGWRVFVKYVNTTKLTVKIRTLHSRLLRIRKVLRSNPGSETGYTEGDFSLFSSGSPSKGWNITVPQIRPRLLHLTSCPIQFTKHPNIRR